jgi:flavodoxin
MKAIVAYRSISGFTRKYVEWIAEELGADLMDCREAKRETFSAYDLVVFGGSLHAVGINGIGVIKRNLDALAGKAVIVFATGASPSREDIPEEILAANFTAEQRGKIKFFYLRGGFDYGKLDVPNKLLMTLLKWKLRARRAADRTPDERGMLAAYGRSVDFTKRDNLKPLLDYAASVLHTPAPPVRG